MTMTPHFSDDHLTVYVGDCRAVMAEMEPASVHCVVTSPPYFGLRDYGTATWEGGDAECDHRQGRPGAGRADGIVDERAQRNRDGAGAMGGDCAKCGARRVDAQLGLEPTPEGYVAAMVEVFREVRRVLRDDGTLWLNLGDSYANDGKWGGSTGGKHVTALHGNTGAGRGKRDTGLKGKDLVGIPWMVARALQAPYYSGRISRERDRVWLAAMIDAEGTICGFDHDRADVGSHRSGAHVAITNTNAALLDEAARIWPTSRSEHQRPSAGHLGTMTSWRWLVHGTENKMAVLRDLYPYLIAKRQQAVVAYSLLLLMADAKRLGHSPQKDAVLAKRRVLTGLLSDLNHQRPVVMPDWLTEPPSLLEPGWYLRSDIIWAKPNPMPESVTDRPTKAHEYVFLLTKSARYYFDQDAVREPGEYVGRLTKAERVRNTPALASISQSALHVTGSSSMLGNPAGRNIRSVWSIATQPYPGAHFATFPEKLVEPCVKAGTSERGVCPECGAPWMREVERTAMVVKPSAKRAAWQAVDVHAATQMGGKMIEPPTSVTTGWRPSCACGGQNIPDPIPATVLDPFAGSGTTGRVANRLSRRAVLIDLSAEYIDQAMERNAQAPLGLT